MLIHDLSLRSMKHVRILTLLYALQWYMVVTTAVPRELASRFENTTSLSSTEATLASPHPPGSSPFHPSPSRHRPEWPSRYNFDVGRHGCSFQITEYGHHDHSASHIGAMWHVFDQAYEYIEHPQHLTDHQGLLSRFRGHWRWPRGEALPGFDPPIMSLFIYITTGDELLRQDLIFIIGRLLREVVWSGKPAIEFSGTIEVQGKAVGKMATEFGKQSPT